MSLRALNPHTNLSAFNLVVFANPEPPELSTASSIIDTVENLIERIRVAHGASQSDAHAPDANDPITGDNDSTQTGEGDSGSREGDASQPDDKKPDPGEDQAMSEQQTDSPAEKPEKFGNWEFWPVQVKFKDEARVDLIDLPREIFKRLLSTTNPDGWVIWTALAADAWENGSDPSKQAVIAGVYRLIVELHSLAKKLGSTKLIQSLGKLDKLSHRVDPLFK